MATAEALLRSPSTGAGAFLPFDTRSGEEVAAGTIPGAIHLDWRHSLVRVADSTTWQRC